MALLVIIILLLFSIGLNKIAFIFILVCLLAFIIINKVKRENERKKLRKEIELEIQEKEKQYQEWLEKGEKLHRYDKGYPIDWDYRAREVYQRGGGRCSICGMPLIFGKGSHIHHIKPISLGGDHSLENLTLLCKKCHIKKHPRLEKLYKAA